MAFQFIEGDFPAGTLAECKAGEWSLILPRNGLFRAPERVVLKGRIESVEVIAAGRETDLIAQIKRGVQSITSGAARRPKAAPMSEALWGSLGDVVGTALGKRELPVLCVLEGGKFFLANVSRKNYEWLANQALMRQTARRFRSADFAEATLALCALMTAAHGWVDGAKKARVSSLIASDETLKTFPAAELEDKFAAYCRALLSNAETGRRAALESIGKLQGEAEKARAAVQIAVSLAGEDAVLDAAEQKIVREVCARLEIYPGEFGLFYSG